MGPTAVYSISKSLQEGLDYYLMNVSYLVDNVFSKYGVCLEEKREGTSLEVDTLEITTKDKDSTADKRGRPTKL